MFDLEEQKQAAFAKYEANHAARRQQDAEDMARWQSDRQELLTNLIPATADHSSFWLGGWLRKGGEITAFVNMKTSRRHIAVRDIAVPPLFATMALQILVPVGVTVTYLDPANEFGKAGHNLLFFVDGFSSVGPGRDQRDLAFCYADTYLPGVEPLAEGN
jgi:hypothetical protein